MSPDPFSQQLDDVVDDLEMAPEHDAAERRRGPRDVLADDVMALRLVEREGVLLLDDGSLPAPSADRRRGRRDRQEATVWERDITRLPRNRVGHWLTKLDDKLTPWRGLHEFRDGTFIPSPDLRGDERVLLFVHGTFSHTRNIVESMSSPSEGADFFRWAEQSYDRILTFDHPTLSVGPVLNGHALAAALRECSADIDVVCHSRGGLVTRWWLESFDRGPGRRRVVFAASPLSGTGLAAPHNLRDSLSLLSNIGRATSTVAGVASAAVPFMTVVSGLFRLMASFAGTVAKTPGVDAAIALVPGLSAQSRVGGNAELESLRAAADEDPVGRYFAVRANFESEDPGWRFWRYFRKSTLVDIGADAVFDGENDLVVDTGSMTELSRRVQIPDDQVLSFGAGDGVHHTNCLAQARTLEFIRESFA